MIVEQTKGLRNLDDILQSLRPLDWDEKVYRVDPNKAQLTRLISKINRKETTDPRFHWYEGAYLNTSDKVTAATDNGGGVWTFTVDHVEYFSPDDEIYIPSVKENCVVLTAASGQGSGDITVKRNLNQYSSVPSLSLPADILNIGNASSEGSGIPEQKQTNPIEKYNYTEIMKFAFGVTGTEAATTHRTGDEMKRLRAEAAVEFAKRVEYKAWFGVRHKEVVGGKTRRYTNGIFSVLDEPNSGAYVKTLNDISFLTESEWDGFIRNALERGAEKRTIFCSSVIIQAVNDFVKGHLQMYDIKDTYGVRVYRYVSPFGEVGLINYKELFTGPVLGGVAVALDLNNIKYRFLRGRDTKLYKNVQLPGYDQQIDMFLAEVGFQITLPETMAKLQVNSW